MKKYRFYIIFFTLLTILLSILIFIRTIHLPYYNQKNSVTKVKYDILSSMNLNEFESFEQYNGQNVYYIAKDTKYVYVFDESKQKIKQELVSDLKEEVIKQKLIELYQIEDEINLTLGYENKVLSYLYIKKLDNQISYIYFNAITGELIKTYEFGS